MKHLPLNLHLPLNHHLPVNLPLNLNLHLALAVALSVALSLTACAHAESHAAMFREPRPPVSSVDLISADTPVTRPYTELGLVQAFGFGDTAASEDVVRELRARAASLGCEGIIRMRIDVGYTRSHGAGVCVRWDGGPSPGAGVRTDPMPQPGALQ